MRTKAEKEKQEFEELHETLINGNQGIFREAMQKYNKKKIFRFIKFLHEYCKQIHEEGDGNEGVFIYTMDKIFKQIDLAFEGNK